VPVTINKPKQVNTAADGGQQVNIQSKSEAKSKRHKKASSKDKPILKGDK
jgi:hypothetical protein